MKKLNQFGHFLTHFSGIRTHNLELVTINGMKKMVTP
jgi:hypothetical protein